MSEATEVEVRFRLDTVRQLDRDRLTLPAEARELRVTFEIHAQEHRAGQFTIPERVANFLGIGEHGGPRGPVGLKIETESGEPLILPSWPMRSGTEIYSNQGQKPNLADHIEPGQKLRVTAWKP